MSAYSINLFSFPAGVRIVTNESCRYTRTWCDVVKTHPGARRKRYSVIKRVHGEPAAYWCTENGGYYLMHPSLLEKLKAAPNPLPGDRHGT